MFTKIKNYLPKAKAWVLAHKLLNIGILVVVVVTCYFLFRNSSSAEVRYVTATVQKGTIVSSVTGSGQVEAENTVDLKARASTEVTYVGVKSGDLVKKGKLLFSLNARTAQKAVRDAQTALETAQLDLEKFLQPPETTEVLQLKNTILNAERSKTDAERDVADAHRKLLNSSIDATTTNLSDTTTAPTVTGTYIKDTEATVTINVYKTGDGAYWSAASVPEGVVKGSGLVSTSTSQPIGDSGLYIKFATTSSNQPEWIISLPNKSASSYTTNLSAYQKTVEDKEKTIRDADLTIAQSEQSLKELYEPDALDLRAKQLAVRQKEDALIDARADLADYYVYAQFDGTMASVDARVGDTASGTLGTLITHQKLATVTLNEVDIAKIQLGQKATITFDAVPDLTLTGSVAEIDSVGTVSQGVVSYEVKINFDVEDTRVKPGMSISAAIVTDVKQDVLTVPTSAIKSNSTGSYVEVFDPPLTESITGATGQGIVSDITPMQMSVEVGISDDTNTEIISGLAEGDQVVSRTVATTSTKTNTVSAPSATSLLGVGGNTRRTTTGSFNAGR